MSSAEAWEDAEPEHPDEEDPEAPELPRKLPPRLVYGSADEFFREFLRKVYRRRIDARRRFWCAEWWRYPEAICRMDALWRSWEALRVDAGTGASLWWRAHADYQMGVLTGSDGPFADLGFDEENTCEAGEPLPYREPPEGLFLDERRTGALSEVGHNRARPNPSPHGRAPGHTRGPTRP